MSREHQILHHLSEGKSQRMIAGTLGVSTWILGLT